MGSDLGAEMEETLERRREDLAERIARRADVPLTVLGVIFLLLVLAETVVRPGPTTAIVLGVVGWVVWAVFVAELGLRVYVAPDRVRYLRRNWWQVVFLVLPFLRFARVLSRVRVLRVSRMRWLRAGRVLSSAIRSMRLATRRLSTRLAWLAAITTIVVLSASQLAFTFAPFESYARALHATALSTITGQALPVDGAFARSLELVLALYSVVVFAALAGTLGAYFLEGVGATLGPGDAFGPAGRRVAARDDATEVVPMREISRSELERALQDVDFPADKDELLEAAVVRSADMERALRSLPPEVEFASFQEVARSVDAAVEHGEGSVQRQQDTT